MHRPRRRGEGEACGKIGELRAAAKTNPGAAGPLLLAAFGTMPETELELARAEAGAQLLAEGLHELILIRKLLSPPE